MQASTAALVLLAQIGAASPLVARAEASTTILSVPESTSTSTPDFDWSSKWETKYQIHHSCNATYRNQLEVALDEAEQLAKHARDHLLRFGHKSELVQKYFGNGSTAEPIGWYDRVVGADKSAVIFRCDDPDENCKTQDKWAGHWRGSNATSETVICDRSFEIRRFLSGMCGLGYTVAASPLNTFWATDLLHRILHVPDISENIVDHYAEDYNDALRQAKEEPEKSGRDSDVLQLFAVDAWAYDIAAPGVGCTGELEVEEKPQSEKASSTSSAAASATSDADSACHTHDDGFVHC